MDKDDYQITTVDTACPRCGSKPVDISNNCYCKRCWFPVIQQTCGCDQDGRITYGHSLPNGDIFHICAGCGARWVVEG